MAITRSDRNQEWRNGVMISDTPVDVDVTKEVVTLDLHGKARAALNANRAFLALSSPTNPQVVAQIQRLTREVNGIIRLLIGKDLLDDTATDT